MADERAYVVFVEWDAEAKVYVAHSDDVPGLATGADTFEQLIDKLRTVVPELLAENGLLPAGRDGREVPIRVQAQRLERIKPAA
jgi:predicted RNase H-like HicB family nuclease